LKLKFGWKLVLTLADFRDRFGALLFSLVDGYNIGLDVYNIRLMGVCETDLGGNSLKA